MTTVEMERTLLTDASQKSDCSSAKLMQNPKVFRYLQDNSELWQAAGAACKKLLEKFPGSSIRTELDEDPDGGTTNVVIDLVPNSYTQELANEFFEFVAYELSPAIKSVRRSFTFTVSHP